jgi:hypothetical protein
VAFDVSREIPDRTTPWIHGATTTAALNIFIPTMARSSGTTVSALRQLLAERFPQAMRGQSTALATGLPAIDEVVGGLPRCALTELVCSAPSCGSQTFLGQLLQVIRRQQGRVALIDGSDDFDPQSWPEDLLAHLVWVRAHTPDEALQAADLLTRDANFALVLLDLRRAPPVQLRRTPSTLWYRLQRAVEAADLALVVITPHISVPSAQLRLVLSRSHSLAALHAARPQLALDLAPQIQRQRVASLGAAG